MTTYLDKYARPFLFKGNQESKKACLLVHGFTGTPARMRYLGEYLQQKGYTARGPLLPGHGTKPEDMVQTGRADWENKVEEEYQQLLEEYESVYLIGFSMGGVLSLLVAQRYDVDKIVSISTPVKLQSKLAYLAPVIKYLKRYQSWPELKEEDKYNLRYSKLPMEGLADLLGLIKEMKCKLQKITSPILIIQPRQDKAVKPESAKIIQEKVSAKQNKIFWLENSEHACTVGPEKEKIHREVDKFLGARG